MLIFGPHFPKNSQYLVNGESDQKSATSKKDAEFNFLSGVCHQIQCIFNQKSVIPILKKVTEKLKKPHYLKNGYIYQKMHGTKKM